MAYLGTPHGSTYEWFRRAQDLLSHGDPDAALVLLDRVLLEDPTSRSAQETRARALFDARHFEEAAAAFEQITLVAPDEDFAHYGCGMSLWRLQRFRAAADHLAMAVVMRPGDTRYAQALGQVQATLRAREEAGLPADGPLPPPGSPSA